LIAIFVMNCILRKSRPTTPSCRARQAIERSRAKRRRIRWHRTQAALDQFLLFKNEAGILARLAPQRPEPNADGF
jgi:hypothetical protein